MKILFIEPSGAGGIAHYTYALACALGNLGVACDILTGKRWSDKKLPDNVRVYPVFHGKKTNPLTLFFRFLRCRKDACIVHWQSTTHPRLVFFLMKILPVQRFPWVFTVHNVLPHEQEHLSEELYRKIYQRMQGLVFHTEFSHKEFHRIYPGLSPFHDIIPLGEYGFLNVSGTPVFDGFDKNSILFFGNIRRYKGLDILIQALALVKSQIPEAKLKIVGQPLEDFKSYRNLIHDLQLDDSVELQLGYIADEAIPQMMMQAAVAVLPYRHIDQSAVLLLALACGKAVIASKVGGLDEVIRDQETGFLVPPENPQALATVIVDLLQSPDKIIAIGKAARADSQARFSWPVIAKKTKLFYENLIHKESL